MADSVASEPPTTIIPIFCTATIPIETLDLLLNRNAVYATPDDYRLHILTSLTPTHLASIDRSSQPPVQPFTTPFLGMSIAQVCRVFVEDVASNEVFSRALLIVLDARSGETETCIVVATCDMPREADEEEEGEGVAERTGEVALSGGGVLYYETLECDFYVARQMAQYADLGVEDLGEGRDRTTVITIDEVAMDG